MTVELTLGNVLTILALFVMALWALVKAISLQQEKRLGERFTELGNAMTRVGQDVRSQADGLTKLEREFLQFQAQMPLHYVRREDYVRGQSVIEAKLDGLATKLENVQLRGQIGNGGSQ